MLGCATRPVELNPRSSLSNQARQALRNSRSRTISDQQAAAWDLAAAKKGETKVASQALRKRQVDPQHGVRFD